MIRALLFDLDGTLVDTEGQTGDAISDVSARHGSPGVSLPPHETCGRSWGDIANTLRARYPLAASNETLEEELLVRWMELVGQAPHPLPGALAALRAAHAAGLRLAVVSSSPRSAIDAILLALGVGDAIPPLARIGSDGVRRYKPDPEGYLLAAARLGVAPSDCLVFEDSSSGLRAARAAGMASVAVLCVSREPELCRSLADATCLHYEALPEGFFAALSRCPAEAIPALLSA